MWKIHNFGEGVLESAKNGDCDSVIFVNPQSLEHDDRPLPARKTIVLVDNAQYLRSNTKANAKIERVPQQSVCLAFSPEMLTPRGSSIVNCPIKVQEIVFFTPFTKK